jgi:hypothetical protein
LSQLIRFPPRRVRAVIICRERDGDGWLVIAGAHGWLCGSRAEAFAEAVWLADNLGLPIQLRFQRARKSFFNGNQVGGHA